VTTTTEELLRVDDLTITYGSGESRSTAVDHATFTVHRGERIAIVGESGSGKSTLALALAGLLVTPSAYWNDAGIVFEGIPRAPRYPTPIPHRVPGISMVFQDAMTSLDPVQTIGTQFSAVLRGNGRASRAAIREQAVEWLRAVGLSDTERVLKNRPYELSGGMRQRVMVALAVCGRPKLLIADEPTSALDASVSRDVMDLLVDVTERESASLVIVSHDIDLCRLYADRIIVMYRGRIVDIVRADHLEEDATHPYTTELVACVPTLASASLPELPTLDDRFALDLPVEPVDLDPLESAAKQREAAA
jgi:peptide/nickel transport system ATP-binding protein